MIPLLPVGRSIPCRTHCLEGGLEERATRRYACPCCGRQKKCAPTSNDVMPESIHSAIAGSIRRCERRDETSTPSNPLTKSICCTLSKMSHPTRAPQMVLLVMRTMMGRKRMIEREMGKSNSNSKKKKPSLYQTARKKL